MPTQENITPEGTIPVGFSENDFFYKNVTAPIAINDPKYQNMCNVSDNELRNTITQFFNDLKINSVAQPTIKNGTESDNYFKGFGVSNPGARDWGISNLPEYPEGRDELINKTILYYRLVCRNKNLATELQNGLSKNMDGELKLQDSRVNYEREYLNRINLGIGILFTCGFIYYSVITSSTSILPSIKLPEVKLPEVKLPEVKLPETISKVNNLPKK